MSSRTMGSLAGPHRAASAQNMLVSRHRFNLERIHTNTVALEGDPQLTTESYEGRSRVYTVAIITCAALWLVLLEGDHGLLNQKDESFIVNTERFVLNFVLLVGWATMDGFAVFWALMPNLRKYNQRIYKNYRVFWLLSLCAILLMNFATAYLIWRSRVRFIQRKSDVYEFEIDPDFHYGNSTSEEAHVFIIIANCLGMGFADLYFIRDIFWPYVKGERPPVVNGPDGVDDDKDANTPPNQRVQGSRLSQPLRNCTDAWSKSLISSWEFFTQSVGHVAHWLYNNVIDIEPREVGVKVTNAGRNLWDQSKSYWGRRWESIREDDHYSHSGWMLSAVITSGIVMIYIYLRMVGGWRHFVDRVYRPSRNCMSQNGVLWDEILLARGYGNSTQYHADVIPGGLANSTAVREFYESAGADFSADYDRGTGVDCELVGFITHVFTTIKKRKEDHVAIEEISGNTPKQDGQDSGTSSNRDRGNPVEDFENRVEGLLVYYFDGVIMNSEWAIWVGFGLGLLMGLNSLISVLAQYKSLSLTLTDGAVEEHKHKDSKNFRDRQDRAIQRLKKLQLRYTSWGELIKVYPLSSTVIFFGILLSTAILQLVVVGGILTWAIASLAAYKELIAVLSRFFSFLLAWSLIYLFDSFVMQGLLVEKLLTDDYRFKHPNLWILYTLIYTMLNLLVGILYAIWRMLLLIIFSLFRFNRLDRSLFPYYQKLDQGHNAFISMVLMHFTIQRNSGKLKLFPNPVELVNMRMGQGNEPGPSNASGRMTPASAVAPSQNGSPGGGYPLSTWSMRSTSIAELTGHPGLGMRMNLPPHSQGHLARHIGGYGQHSMKENGKVSEEGTESELDASERSGHQRSQSDIHLATIRFPDNLEGGGGGDADENAQGSSRIGLERENPLAWQQSYAFSGGQQKFTLESFDGDTHSSSMSFACPETNFQYVQNVDTLGAPSSSMGLPRREPYDPNVPNTGTLSAPGSSMSLPGPEFYDQNEPNAGTLSAPGSSLSLPCPDSLDQNVQDAGTVGAPSSLTRLHRQPNDPPASFTTPHDEAGTGQGVEALPNRAASPYHYPVDVLERVPEVSATRLGRGQGEIGEELLVEEALFGSFSSLGAGHYLESSEPPTQRTFRYPSGRSMSIPSFNSRRGSEMVGQRSPHGSPLSQRRLGRPPMDPNRQRQRDDFQGGNQNT